MTREADRRKKYEFELRLRVCIEEVDFPNWHKAKKAQKKERTNEGKKQE